MDIKKFTDEANIISIDKQRYEPPVPIMTVDPDEQERVVEIPEPKKQRKRSKKKANDDVEQNVDNTARPQTTRLDMLYEVFDKTERQRLAKEVDMRWYQKLYQNASSNDERKAYEQTREALARDIKKLDVKLQVIHDMIRTVE